MSPEDINLKKRVRKLFIDLKQTIPCKTCRDSYRMFIRQLPIDDNLDSKEKLSYWLYRIHNMVNAKLRKQERQKFLSALQQLEEYARLRRVSPEQYKHMKYRLKCQIMITGPDPQFSEIKQKYKYARL